MVETGSIGSDSRDGASTSTSRPHPPSSSFGPLPNCEAIAWLRRAAADTTSGHCSVSYAQIANIRRTLHLHKSPHVTRSKRSQKFMDRLAAADASGKAPKSVEIQNVEQSPRNDKGKFVKIASPVSSDNEDGDDPVDSDKPRSACVEKKAKMVETGSIVSDSRDDTSTSTSRPHPPSSFGPLPNCEAIAWLRRAATDTTNTASGHCSVSYTQIVNIQHTLHLDKSPPVTAEIASPVSSYDSDQPRPGVRIGPKFQAEIPEKQTTKRGKLDSDVDSESRMLMGTPLSLREVESLEEAAAERGRKARNRRKREKKERLERVRRREKKE